MSPLRRCSRIACGKAAAATLTYVYRDSTAVVGPLATVAEPHTWDLCERHAAGLTAPVGWALLRQAPDVAATRSSDDLEALANAVREAARPHPQPGRDDPPAPGRPHLRVLPEPTTT